ncbi:RNA pyrophosphohydrolase [Paralimibaculum aggregatum]|uniref:RNA pyrophosphohydrolase n=1 Tax=Paralimibaculum aggregatum TaxID=3036245 RepID=A0ABQ6LGR7_9RHOB|nr:RNA pyrophosphohydrolase [Limibaculum sp. NKW23]GMG82487.1 RNA pyrophosphohydrolase [Limibaculum sp. NKW23]
MPASETDAARLAALPYRPCVGVMLLDPRGLIFAGQRIDNPGPAWQMPQGGIDKGEDPEAAALRELGEETGIRPEQVRILRASPVWRRYDLPPELLGRIWKGRYRGQEQRWFAARFLGTDADVRIDTDEPEFSRWAWMPAPELAEKIVPFKRALYREIFEEFADLIG